MTHDNYVATEEDDRLVTRQPDSLSMFLNSVIPAQAVFEHYRRGVHIMTTPLQPQYPHYPRRPYIAIASNNVDFADWTIAHTTHFEAHQPPSPRTVLNSQPVGNMQEMFVGRWLRTRPTPPVGTPTYVSHPYAGYAVQSIKRYKPGPFGEIRRGPPRSFAGGTDARSSENSPPVEDGDTINNKSPVVKDSRPKLHSVGGVEKILCHSAAYVNPCVYVFGGLTKNGCSDRLWSLLPHESGWRYIEPVGDQKPSNRYGHTLVAWRKQLVLFGGDGGPGYLDDLWYFDTEKSEWDRISLEQEQEGRRPGARTGHSAVVYKDRMLIFGGWRGGDGFCDVWSCNLEERNWELLFYRGIYREHDWRPFNHEGLKCNDNTEVPEPRQWHVTGVFGDYMYIHGGYGFGGVLRQVWRFHILNKVWEPVKTRGYEPAARCRHSGVVIDEDKWVIFGGKDAEGSYFCDIFVLDISTHMWRMIVLFSPPHPMPGKPTEWWNGPDILRHLPYLHCQATAYDSKNKCIIVTGGCDGETAAYDSTILIKRYPAAALLFEQWTKSRPIRYCQPLRMDLPEFLYLHPEPAAREILRFL